MPQARTAYTVTLDFAALWETTNALVIRRRSIEDLVRHTTDPKTLRILATTLDHLQDAERTMRDALDVPEPTEHRIGAAFPSDGLEPVEGRNGEVLQAHEDHFDWANGWSEPELREAFGR